MNPLLIFSISLLAVASMKSDLVDRFFKFTGALGEILKLGALFVFGGLVSFHFWKDFVKRQLEL